MAGATKVSVSIMAHPDRAHHVETLQAALGARVPVGWDEEGPPRRDPDRIWRTARRAWELRDPAADWHLLLQDDAIVAANLLDELPGALEQVPQRAVVSLYLGDGRPLSATWGQVTAEAQNVGASWIVAPRVMWGVGVLVRTAMIPDMLSWCDRQHGIADDMRVGRWGQRSRLETWYTWPCLVDHPDGGSLIGHGGGRTARSFRRDARGADWSGPIVRWSRR